MNMAAERTRDTLTPEECERLVSLARSCRAAIHAVGLYPEGHPAIEASISRLELAGRQAAAKGPFDIAVLPENLQLRGCSLPRPDTAVAELAGLLHRHLIGNLAVLPGATAADWRRFLVLAASAPEELRSQGGIERAWSTGGGKHIEIREIDYAEVLKDRSSGETLTWALIAERCLKGEAIDLDERMLRSLVEILIDPDRLQDLAKRLDETGRSGTKASALVEPLALALGALTGPEDAERAESILSNMAGMVSGFSPENMLAWLRAAGLDAKAGAGSGTAHDGTALPQRTTSPAAAVLSRLSEAAIARFVAGSLSSGAPTARLAEAIKALVPEDDRRTDVLETARSQLSCTSLGHSKDFDRLWLQLQAILASYDDSAYVPEDYGGELDNVLESGEQGDQIEGDPPERVAGWLATVNDTALRQLDVRLLLDLLEHESSRSRREEIGGIVGGLLEDLLLIGDFEPALQLLEALCDPARQGDGTALAGTGAGVVKRLLDGQALTHIAYHLQKASEEEFETIKRFSLALGPGVVNQLAEMVAVESLGRVRQRLTQILIAFGSVGRESVEKLKQSPNPSVRRTAIYILREFGGSGALPDLESLIDDSEPRVQREAVRAILTIATDEAYDVLRRALTSGSERTRAAIFNHLQAASDQRLVPLFCHILSNTCRHSKLLPVALRSIRALGELGGKEAVEALTATLRDGQWWAPFRTAKLRRAAARALARTGNAQAAAILLEAAARGPRGVAVAARSALESAPPRDRST